MQNQLAVIVARPHWLPQLLWLRIGIRLKVSAVIALYAHWMQAQIRCGL